ncbi:ABC transporter ATP-binding protein [Euzebya tangerina]|uniref:ABC transporter ATP-binding protein n=1 Tax=Euzebya tangerina TaxID=591198 RepID=UPI000E31464A|nr:ABC transporter ATP-binding protein [Euzebya tangerina]
MPAIQVRNLRKTYGKTVAVDDLSFQVTEGEIVAILGPNGAGKTTTVEILEGHRDREAGEVSVLGFDPATGGRAFRERIGIVLQQAGIDDAFSVREIISHYRSLYSRRRDADEVIELVGLAEKRDERVKNLSGGQQRRVDLALGLIGDPDLIFLDEPTTGFDPSARRKAWGLVDNLRALGKTILLTTHYMDEAEYLADRVIVIAEGRVIATGTPEELVDQAGAGAAISFRLPEGAQPPTGLGIETTREGDHVSVRTAAPTKDLSQLTSWAVEHGIELASLELRRPTLEETYLDLIGQRDLEGAI